MPRRGGGFHAGEFYHLYNRGVDRAAIFHEAENYLYFARLLIAKAERLDVVLVAYCLMPNHFHLLARPGRDDTIGRFMTGVCGSYAQALNAQRRRSGALFQGRYRAIHVDRDEYLAHLARYVHLNPVAAGLVSRPQDWPHFNYIDLREDGVLVGGIFADASAYHRFVEAPQTSELPASLKLAGSLL
jgi:REP element-mobilizing transposase RayT